MGRDDGGPAFPRSDMGYSTTFDGMTLRDWFAGQALAGMGRFTELDADWAARTAYDIADAMISLRASLAKAK